MNRTNHLRRRTSGFVSRRSFIVAAASAAALTPITAVAGTTGSAETVSTAGSTALKNWFVKTSTFTDVTPGTQLTIQGQTYPASIQEWNVVNSSSNTLAFQLAPQKYNNGQLVESTSNYADQASAVRFEFHESGSVEGILEMANDQIGPVTYVTQNVDRNPATGIGNAVWVNFTQIGGSTTAKAFSPVTGADTNNTSTDDYHLGNFYSGTDTFTSYSTQGGAQASFNLAGGNLNGGQNAVQLAVSDAIPLQVFSTPSTGTDLHASTPWLRTPSDANYGSGNPVLVAGTLGTAQGRQIYQTTAALNMSATAINPRNGVAFGTGPWNSGGLNNLNSQTVAVTATLFVANPGTGLTQVNRTDSQWLETTGRLQNGALFNMTTRDVNSGTRNVAALETGIDPTWASGKNDNGNGNAADGAGTAVAGGTGSQINIGPELRFSNKTAGGNELRPTVQVNRMAVGTLAIADASGNDTQGNADPVRGLRYSDSLNGSTPYVLANYYTITGTSDPTNNPNGQQYTIFQNEQFVTLKAPDASYNATSPNIQGDSVDKAVSQLIGNTINSVVAYQGSSAASPAAGLESTGYILPQQMQVRKGMNGLSTNTVTGVQTSIVVPNDVADGAASLQSYNSASAAAGNSTEVSKNNVQAPEQVTIGTGSFYGGSSAAAAALDFNGQIPITTVNYLFGNFNQTGVRDFDSVVVQAQKAQAALAGSSAGVSALNGSGSNPQAGNNTLIITGISALDTVANTTQNSTGTFSGVTKGDLITMGDYNGDGRFDGMDLYLMATGASLTSTGSYQPTEIHTATGTVFTTGHINTNAAGFATAIEGAVLNKNTALDYLQANASPQQKIDAAAVLELPTGVAALPRTATLIGTDLVTGQTQYTFDSAGINAFNKTDVNRDGVVDFNDAVLIDDNNGQDFSNLSNALAAYMPAPYTGITSPVNLILLSQTDASTKIGANDLTIASAALTGTGNTNWYGYTLNKNGPGTIVFARTGGTVTVFPAVNGSTGAGFNISAGTIVIGAGQDPFTDSSATSNTDLTKSIAVVVNGGTLEYDAGTAGITLFRIGALNASSGGLVRLDPAAVHTARTVIEVGSLNLTGGKIDLGNGDLISQNGNLAAVTAAIARGYNLTGGGNFNGGSGIISSSAASDISHLTTLGVVLNNQSGTNLFNSATPFDGIIPGAGDVLVKYTYFGDANLDGKVDGSDYSLTDAGYLSHGLLTGWYHGDFNYDGVVDGSDYSVLDNAYNNQGNQLTTPTAIVAVETDQVAAVTTAAVPEPTSLVLTAAGAVSLLTRRKRNA